MEQKDKPLTHINNSSRIQQIKKGVISLLPPTLLVFSICKCYISNYIFLKNEYILWISLLCLFSLCYIYFSKKKTLKLNLYDMILLFLIIIILYHYLFNPTINLFNVSIWYYTAYIYYYFLIRQIIKIEPKTILKTLLISIVGLAFLNSVIGLLQYVEWLPSENNNFKVIGLFYSPNQLGILLSLGILSLAGFIKIYKPKSVLKNILPFVNIFLFIILLLTESRGALLALFLSIIPLYYGNIKKYTATKYKPIIISAVIPVFLAIGCIGYYLYKKNPDSIYGRYLILKISTQEILKKPLGHGISSFSREYNIAKANYFKANRNWQEIKHADFVFHAYNDFIELTFELGLHWLILCFIFMIVLLKKMTLNKETKVMLSILIQLSFFICTNTLISYPLFVLIGLFSAQFIIQTSKPTYIFRFKNNILNKAILSIPLLYLVIAIPLRIHAEKSIYSIAKNHQQKTSISKLTSLTEKIDNKGLEKFYIWHYLKGQAMDSLALSYLKESYLKSKMPSIGRHLAYANVNKSNLKRAIEILQYNRNVEPYRFEAKVDLFYLYKRFENINKAKQHAIDIINSPVKIHSQKVVDYKSKMNLFLEKHDNITTLNDFNGVLSRKKAFKSKKLNKKLIVSFYVPELERITNKLPVLFVNDGDSYIKKGKLVQKVDSLIHNNIIKPIMVVFVPPLDLNKKYLKRWEIRQELYYCNDLYSDFIEEELFPYMVRKYHVSQNRSIIGVSFGGLSAAYTALTNPDLFENVLLQSPAFHTQKKIYDLYKDMSKQNFNLYISYGTGDDTERQNVPFINILKKKKYDLEVDIIPNGNHNWKLWEPQLNDILLAYFGN